MLVIIMIKNLKPVLLASVVGCASALAIFRVVEDNTLSTPPGNVIAIQLGVFKDEAAALEMKEKCGGEIFEESGIYRLYYSILKNDDNIEFVKTYLNEQGISYYLKPLNLSKSVLKEGEEYETVMAKSKSDARLSINKELLNMYKEVV